MKQESEIKLNEGFAAANFAGILRGMAIVQDIGYSKKLAIQIYQELIKVCTKYPYASYVAKSIVEDKAKLQKLLNECTNDCPDCDGTEYAVMSGCCGATIKNELCSDCMEHSEGDMCQCCKGTGYVFKEGVS
tara:strand:+ start:440 stop:835 length:396 start_codon:yes stop_codon:yes gene_type:complete